MNFFDLHASFVRRVARYAFRRLAFAGTMYGKEDLEQEALIVLARLPGQENGIEPTRDTAYIAVLRRLKRLRRKADVLRGDRVPLDNAKEVPDPLRGPEDTASLTELRELVDSLPDRQQSALSRFYGVGLPRRECVSVDSDEWHRRSALHTLRERTEVSCSSSV